MSAFLIRHGKTAGNLEGRYIGCRTDEPLSEAGRQALKALCPPQVSRVFASPMRRCAESAEILFPQIPAESAADFREIDFGDFEGKNYEELNGRADYQAWIDSGGEKPFPHGESLRDFCARCARAYEAVLREAGPADFAVVAHGGTIMAIMQAFARPRGSYYDFQVENGRGYRLEADGRYERL